MVLADLQNGLKGFTEELTSQTYLNTFRVQSRDSLLADGLGTRANSIWKMAQYIVAKYDNRPSIPMDSYLKGWRTLVKNYKNQYLFIETSDHKWLMYDSDGTFLGDDAYIENFLRKSLAIVKDSGMTPTTNLSPIPPQTDEPSMISQDYQYMAAIKTKPFLILGGFSGTGKSIAVKSLAFSTCPCDGYLNTSETSPGNYLLLSVKPNWHDATDITGFRSSVNRNYYVTDFMRFVIKAKMYEKKNVPFFVCLDEMNLAPVEEYFADFLSVIESRTKKTDRTIVTDALIPASVFNDSGYADDFNIFLSLGIHPTVEVTDLTDFNAQVKDSNEDIYYQEQWLVDELKQHGMTIPQNLIVIGTVNMDDTTNSFSRKVIDRAMTFETVVGKFSVEDYFGNGTQLLMEYCKHPAKGELYISDEVRATDLESNYLTNKEKEDIINFINNINQDLSRTPFQISYRVLNETILLYRSKKEIDRIVNGAYEVGVEFSLILNDVFDDILMQKILPRIEGDYDKCHVAIANLYRRAKDSEWKRSISKLAFMEQRFGNDKSGFTSFWN